VNCSTAGNPNWSLSGSAFSKSAARRVIIGRSHPPGTGAGRLALEEDVKKAVTGATPRPCDVEGDRDYHAFDTAILTSATMLTAARARRQRGATAWLSGVAQVG